GENFTCRRYVSKPFMHSALYASVYQSISFAVVPATSNMALWVRGVVPDRSSAPIAISLRPSGETSKCSTRVRSRPGADSLASKPLSTAPVVVFSRARPTRVVPLLGENVPAQYTRVAPVLIARTSPQLIFAVNDGLRAPLATLTRARPRWAVPLTVLNDPPR